MSPSGPTDWRVHSIERVQRFVLVLFVICLCGFAASVAHAAVGLRSDCGSTFWDVTWFDDSGSSGTPSYFWSFMPHLNAGLDPCGAVSMFPTIALPSDLSCVRLSDGAAKLYESSGSFHADMSQFGCAPSVSPAASGAISVAVPATGSLDVQGTLIAIGFVVSMGLGYVGGRQR